MALTDAEIRRSAGRDKKYKITDSGGMYLEVHPNGSKYWRLKYRFGGKEKQLALGVYPDVGLKDARERRDAAKKRLGEGVDPGAARQAEKLTRHANAENSFEAVAREWHEKFSSDLSASHAIRQLRRLEVHVFPYLGGRPVSSIETPEVFPVLERIEKTGHIETAHRVKSIIGQVMRYAVATSRAKRDPTPDLRGAIKPAPVRHHAAIVDPEALGPFLRAIHAYPNSPIVAASLKLSPLVFQRPGELRLAQWKEFDLDDAIWEIPSDRMKRKKEGKEYGPSHLVPLSRQAVEILRGLRAMTGHGKHVFPSVRGDMRPMSDGTIGSAFRLMGIDSDTAVPHGWRATARTLATERLGFPAEIVEMQLAHEVRDSLGRAYNRTQWLDKRRELMQTWADYLDELRQKSSVGTERTN